MARLADITRESRIILKLLAAAGALVFIIFIAVNGVQIFQKIFFPPPPAPPKEEFGKLPRITFGIPSGPKPTFRINTVSGQLPVFSDRIDVYKILVPDPSLNALKNARENARSARFEKQETKVTDTIYEWQNDQGIIIRYNIITNNFDIDSDLTGNNYSTGEVFSRKDDAFRFVKNFLGSLNAYTDDIDQNQIKLTYYAINNRQLVEVPSQNQAQVLRVDLFQNSVSDNKLKIYYPDIDKSIMFFYIIVTPDDKRPEIAKGTFNHSIVDLKQSSTYPIKSANDAYRELQNGANSLVIKADKNATSFDVTDVSLGYYIGREGQQYLLPVFIFQGNGFVAFVQAVSDTSLSN